MQGEKKMNQNSVMYESVHFKKDWVVSTEVQRQTMMYSRPILLKAKNEKRKIENAEKLKRMQEAFGKSLLKQYNQML